MNQWKQVLQAYAIPCFCSQKDSASARSHFFVTWTWFHLFLSGSSTFLWKALKSHFPSFDFRGCLATCKCQGIPSFLGRWTLRSVFGPFEAVHSRSIILGTRRTCWEDTKDSKPLQCFHHILVWCYGTVDQGYPGSRRYTTMGWTAKVGRFPIQMYSTHFNGSLHIRKRASNWESREAGGNIARCCCSSAVAGAFWWIVISEGTFNWCWGKQQMSQMRWY